MSNVNLNLYKIFCKVAESKSYNEASDKLDGLSVANISTQISNLENLIIFSVQQIKRMIFPNLCFGLLATEKKSKSF